MKKISKTDKKNINSSTIDLQFMGFRKLPRSLCISSTLVSSSIHLLKLTKSIISENSIEFQKMSEIHEYLREGRNFQSYRKMLKDIKYCVLPYNGMPMSDIVFVCERTPLLVNPGEISWKCISLQKFLMNFLDFKK